MPRYEIIAPDGHRYEVTAPDGVSQEEVLQYVQSQTKTPPQTPLTEDNPNPIDRFILDKFGPQLARAPDLTRGGRLGASRLESLLRGAADLPVGAAQLAANVAGMGDPVNRFIKAEEGEFQEQRKAAGREGFDWYRLGGNVLSPPAVAAMKLPLATTIGKKVLQGAAVGAGFGAASPVTEGDYAPEKGVQIGTGAVAGAAIPAGIEAARYGARIGRNIIDPLLPGGAQRTAGRLLSEAAGKKRAAIEGYLEEGRVLVPGSRPTAAEAAAPAGSAEFSAMQRLAQERQPSEFSAIAKSQEAARLGAVRNVGRDAQALFLAHQARDKVAKMNYGAVEKLLVELDDGLNTLLKRPSMEKAFARAKELAAEAGEEFGEEGGIRVGQLHFVKMALDDMLTNPERFSIGASEVRAIGSTKDAFINWLETKAPLYRVARERYAEMSKPINRMQVGQELEKALVKPIGEGERAGVFAGAMSEAPRTIKKATGRPVADKLEDILNPDEFQAMKNVLADLSRKGEHERLASAGLKRAREIQEPFGLPATGPLHQGYMIFKTVLGRVSKGINEETLELLASEMQVPEKALKLLRSAPSQQRQAIINSILQQKFGTAAVVGAVAGETESRRQLR